MFRERYKIADITNLLACLVILSTFGCFGARGPVIKVDMSYEHDEGRFNPAEGDVVSIAGNFNDWEPGVDQMTDSDGDWIYEINVSEIQDSIDFKFVVSSSANLDLPNSGWELIPNRSIPKSKLEEFKPVFVFNEPWKPSEVENILFTVSMNNQEILEFFDPDKDKVVVSGTFIDWDPAGIELEDQDKDGIYTLEVPVEINPVKRPLYKFRIVKGEGITGYIPNDGWEIIDDRVLVSADQKLIFFNNQKRIARFLISAEWLENESSNGIQLSDIFQVRFYLGEESYLSEPMVQNEKGMYETSVAIPMSIDKVKWSIVENQSIDLSGVNEDVVSHNGAILTIK